MGRHANAGRDPFKPLVAAPVTGGSDAGNQTVSGNPTSGTPSTAPTSGTPVTNPSSPTSPVVVSPPTSPSQGGAPTNGTTGTPLSIQLLSTKGEKTAVFRVDYAHHRFRKFTVKAPSASSTTGTVFDKEFALIGIQDGSVTVQVGDATPFDMSRGMAFPV